MPLSYKKLANINKFHSEINSPHPKGATSNLPLLLSIEATTRCNFKCVHCSQTFSNQIPTDLNLELFQKIVPLLETARELYLFGDGEVLLNVPRHLAMIAAIYQQDPGCFYGFSTNGKLLTPETYELYVTAGARYIQLSIDAAQKELYEAMRKGGRFDELIANLEGIKALRANSKTKQPQLWLATVISKQNYQQLPLLAELAKKYDFSYWYINGEYPHNPGRNLLSLTMEQGPELERIKLAIMREFSRYFAINFDPSLGLTDGKNAERPIKEWPVFCTVPWQRFELKANGEVKLCPYYHESICSLHGKSVLEVWNGIEFRKIRMAFSTGTSIPPYCTNCNSGIRRQYLPDFPLHINLSFKLRSLIRQFWTPSTNTV